jgi:DNA anti-recombination protein RmuC
MESRQERMEKRQERIERMLERLERNLERMERRLENIEKTQSRIERQTAEALDDYSDYMNVSEDDGVSLGGVATSAGSHGAYDRDRLHRHRRSKNPLSYWRMQG